MNLLDKIAYDTGGYTVQEILSSFCKKIIEIIDLVNKNEEVCDEAHSLIENIRNEVVPELVEDIMKELQDDGYFDSLVNVTLIDQLRTELTTLLNQTITDYTTRLDNFDSKLDTITTREYISLDTFGDTQEAYQQCFDYCNEKGLGILIPSKSFLINEPIILKEQGTYFIKGCNTNMNDGSRVKSKSVLVPKTILFKGELTNNNTTVYMTLQDVRISPENDIDGYAKDGTYVFYNLNLFGLNVYNLTCRNIDVFCQGYVSKASVITNSRVSFIKTALFRGNQFNGCFMADSQITNCYFSGGYPVTLFHGRCVNTTVSNCFFDFFKHMISLEGNKKLDGFKFKDNTIGFFYRWFKENRCDGHIEIIDNKIEACSKQDVLNIRGTNFVVLDTDMELGTYGVFFATTWQNNIHGYETDKCKVHNNRFVSCDNMFTKSNSSTQVDIRNNTHNNVTGITYELSYRKDSLGENASFYCDALDNKVVEELPTISSSGEYFVFNGQRCFLDGREYVLVDYKWVETGNNNVFSKSVTPTYCGSYDGKPLYKRLISGTITVGSTGFKTPINLPEAEILFVDLTHSYWNVNGEVTKFSFNGNIKSGVIDKTINLLAYNSNKVLMYQQEGASSELNIDYVIAVEYTLT